MYRLYDPFKDNHIAYFDAGNLETNELPNQTPTPEKVAETEAVNAIRALNRSVKNRQGEGGTPPRSPAGEVLRKFSPVMHHDGEEVQVENADGFKPLIEAYTHGGLDALKARVLVEMASYVRDHSDDKTELRKIIEFSQGEPQEASEEQTTAHVPPEEASDIVANFVTYADEVYRNNQSLHRGGSISSEKRGFFRNLFRRNKNPAAATNYGFSEKSAEFAQAYRQGGMTALKAEFFAHFLPQQKDINKIKAEGDVLKILAFRPQIETPNLSAALTKSPIT